jgi:ATP-dependent RNA helicase DeaD
LLELLQPNSKTVQALIVVPTRELAIQVAEEINSLRGNKKMVITPIYGGQSIDQQFRRLHKGVDIVVGTPGRVIDHLHRKTLKLHEISHLVLDEADEMLNMGFIDDMEEIMKHTNKDKKTLLFSATMPKKIKDLAHKYLDGYVFLAVKNADVTPNLTDQIYFEVKASDRLEALCRIIDFEVDFYGLIFCRTKRDVDKLAAKLQDRGYDSEAIHGDISQAKRERILKKFKQKKSNILVATDVAARGIDVDDLTHVINYALPQDPESYVHRIGRTGRAGKKGTAVTFITPSEYKKLLFIQRKTKTDIRKSKLPKIKDIIKAKRNKIDEEIGTMFSDDIENTYYNWAKNLLEEGNATEILAAFLKYSFGDDLDPAAYEEVREYGKPARNIDTQGKARLFVAVGKKQNYNAKKLVKMVRDKVSIKNSQIDGVHVLSNFSFITVPFSKAEKIIEKFKKPGQRPLITHAKKKK